MGKADIHRILFSPNSASSPVLPCVRSCHIARSVAAEQQIDTLNCILYFSWVYFVSRIGNFLFKFLASPIVLFPFLTFTSQLSCCGVFRNRILLEYLIFCILADSASVHLLGVVGAGVQDR